MRRNMLVLIAGTHGVEGHCGSGAEIAWLRNGGPDEAAQGHRRAADPRHQPARLRLDAARDRGQRRPQPQLRRSRQGLSEERGLSRAGRRRPAASEWNDASLAETERVFASYAQKHGAFGLQGAMSGGQYTHADGIFFGGNRPTWSNRTLRAIARAELGNARQVGSHRLPYRARPVRPRRADLRRAADVEVVPAGTRPGTATR